MRISVVDQDRDQQPLLGDLEDAGPASCWADSTSRDVPVAPVAVSWWA
jgi:hypothetical protein